MIRKDHSDVIYKTEKEKFRAAIEEIKSLHKSGRPVLVGSISIEKSETLSSLLVREGIQHHVLNAKNHEKEAEKHRCRRPKGGGHDYYKYGRKRYGH